MNIFDALKECVHLGKKFECKECVSGMYMSYDNEDNAVYMFNNANGTYAMSVIMDSDFLNGNWTEYDDTEYYDFKTACVISKRDNVWIKRKGKPDITKIKFASNESLLDSNKDIEQLFYDEIMAEDWMVVK